MKQRIFTLAIQDLWFHRSKVVWLICFLSLAIFSALMSLSFKSSIERFIYSQARLTLSADLSISSLQPLNLTTDQALREKLKPTQTSSSIDFRSMVSSGKQALLCEIRAIESSYPLVGRIQTSPQGRELSVAPIAYVYPEVLKQLKLNVGDRIFLGKKEFSIEAVVNEDPGATTQIFSFTPRIYIHRSFVEETALLTQGSQIFYRYFFLLSEPLLDDKLKLIQNSYGEDFFIATPADSLDVMKRFFGVFDKTIYILSLSVVLMSLFVSFALFQSFLRTRLSQLATLKIFGSSNFDLLSYFSVQIVTLSVFASGLCFLILPPLAHSAEVWIRNQGLKTFSWDVSLESVFFAIIGVLLISASFLFPARNEIMKSKIADLFNAPSRDETGGGSFSWRSLLPLILIVFALTVWLTQSLAVSLGVITAFGLLAAMALGLKAGLLHMLTRRLTPGPLHLAAINLSKNRLSVTLSFIAISAVSLILQIIPHIKTSLENQLKITRSSELPTLFVFNIPESEMNDLSAFFQANGADARYQSPMIPARLVTINGQEPTERRLKRFPVRLSYRKDLLSSEKLIQSTAASPGVPSLSIEKDFADRSKIKLGDLLEFDILGVKIEGKATSVREVDWLKFHPAFFIQFEPGHLEDAPKTLISSVYTAAGTDAEALLLKTIDKFPTVSVLDIRRTLDRVLGIIESMALSLQMASLLSLSLVALTFLGLLAFSLWNRRYEASVMKALGGHPSDISRVFIYEYLILAALGGLVGFLLSAAAAAALIWGVFDFSLELSWFTSVSVVLSLCLLCAGLATQIARNLVLRGLR